MLCEGFVNIEGGTNTVHGGYRPPQSCLRGEETKSSSAYAFVISASMVSQFRSATGSSGFSSDKPFKCGLVKSHRNPLLARIRGATRDASAKLMHHVGAPLTNICLTAGSALLTAASSFGSFVSSTVTQAAENDSLRVQVLDLQQEVERMRADRVQYANALYHSAIVLPNHAGAMSISANCSSSSSSRKRSHPSSDSGGDETDNTACTTATTAPLIHASANRRHKGLADEGRRLLESLSSLQQQQQLHAEPLPAPAAQQLQQQLQLQLPSECPLALVQSDQEQQATANTAVNARCSFSPENPPVPASAPVLAAAAAVPMAMGGNGRGFSRDMRASIAAAAQSLSQSQKPYSQSHSQSAQAHTNTHTHKRSPRRRVSFGPDDICEVPHLCDAGAPTATFSHSAQSNPSRHPALPPALLASIAHANVVLSNVRLTAPAVDAMTASAGESVPHAVASIDAAQKRASMPSLPFNANDLLAARLNPTNNSNNSNAAAAGTAGGPGSGMPMLKQRRTSIERLSPTFGRAVTSLHSASRAFNAGDIRSVQLKPVLQRVGTSGNKESQVPGHVTTNTSSYGNNNNNKPVNLHDSLRLALRARFANAIPRTVPHTPGYESDSSDWI